MTDISVTFLKRYSLENTMALCVIDNVSNYLVFFSSFLLIGSGDAPKAGFQCRMDNGSDKNNNNQMLKKSNQCSINADDNHLLQSAIIMQQLAFFFFFPSSISVRNKNGERREKGNVAISSLLPSKDKIKRRAWKPRSEAPIWQHACPCPLFCPIFPVQSVFNCSSGATGSNL